VFPEQADDTKTINIHTTMCQRVSMEILYVNV